MGKNSRKNQKYYKMKGCSKNEKHLGGSSDLVLAYPSKNVHTVPNSALAYTGKGGSCTGGFSSLSYTPPNVNGANPAFASSGPSAGGYNFLNPQTQRGGSCGCGSNVMTGGGVKPIMKGGSCSSCVSNFLKGGAGPHRVGCKCSVCKNKMNGGAHRVGCKCSACKNKMYGGSGNNGIPYPNGLVGSAWTPSVGGWPGVKGIGGDSNYLAYNKYHSDISRDIVSTGANRPFSIGGSRKNRTLKNRKQNGGSFSNFLAQDLINVGRQIQYGLGSAYNGIAGYPQAPNPLPWKGQFQYNSDSVVTIPKQY